MSDKRKARASVATAPPAEPPPEPVAPPRPILDRIAFGPVAAVRPWLFAKALYLLLALDVWHTLVGPAWRYGAAGFNVSHFAILDALPIPTRAAYVGMLVIVGAMAVVAALVPTPPRALSAAITVLYTWGWSCSMLDSYQHHYLITTLLFAACFFPRHTAMDVLGPVGPPPKAAGGKKKAAASTAPTRPPALSQRDVANERFLLGAFLTGLGLVATLIGLVLAPPGGTYVVFTGLVVGGIRLMLTPPRSQSLTASPTTTVGTGPYRTPEMVSAAATRAATPPDGLRRVRSLGWTMATLFAGIVYTFTAISKLEPEWRSGAALRNITNDGATMRGAMDVAAALGVHADTLFPLLGSGMILVQLICAFGYFTATVRDDASPSARRGLGALSTLALLLALSFHVGAEYIGLQIGWFSYYMIVLAFVALSPARWLAAVAAFVTAPVRTGRESIFERIPLLAASLGLVGAVVAAWAGVQIDLPGAYEAGVLVGLVSLGLAGLATVRIEHRRALGRAALAIGVGMLVCTATMTTGEGRYDFYRFGGGDFRRRHEYQRALEDYREADRYAPPGESREDRIHEMEEAIRREGL